MIITDILLKVKRFATAIKIVGLAFLAFHCSTADIRFNPIWVLAYVAIAVVLAFACVAVERLIHKIRPAKRSEAWVFTAEEAQCAGKIHAQSQALRRKPWQLILIAGEDGFFFLPLLYIGITLPAAVAASAIFAAMHYRDKPAPGLVAVFLFSLANALVVLPHGILPMVLGHLILDAMVFSLAPTMKKWIEANRPKTEMPTHAAEATSKPTPSADSLPLQA